MMHQKSILDHKAIMNMKLLSSDKSSFKLWNEKFVNAFEAAIKGARTVFELITNEIDTGKVMKDEDDIEQWYEQLEVNGEVIGRSPELAWDELGEKISFVLVDKCEGDARLRIRTKKNGRGILQFIELYKWFMGTSGEGLSQRAVKIMTPTAPKNEADIAAAIDRWCTQLEAIERHGKCHQLADVYKVAALKSMMIGKARDYFETLEDMKFDDVLKKCKDYSVRKRLEHAAKKNDNDMDLDNVQRDGEEE